MTKSRPTGHDLMSKNTCCEFCGAGLRDVGPDEPTSVPLCVNCLAGRSYQFASAIWRDDAGAFMRTSWRRSGIVDARVKLRLPRTRSR